MKVSVAQIDCEPSNHDANHVIIIQKIKEAAENGSDLVVFPEMSDTGYDMDVIQKHPVTLFFQTLRTAAEANEIAVICGLAEIEDGKIYNSVIAINKDGDIPGKYRKTHLFSLAGEDKVITAGDEFVTVFINDITFGLMICYDIRFPEMSRKLVDMGAEVLVVVAAFPHPRGLHWTTLINCRAIENQVYVVAANRTGTDKDLSFCEGSSIIDSNGIVLTEPAHKVCLITADIDIENVHKDRSRMNILADRRKDLY